MVDQIIHEIGGQGSIVAFTRRFYEILTTDERTKGRFIGRDIEHIKLRQNEYLGRLFGSDVVYQGVGMREIHAGMDISNDEFHIVLGIARDVLLELGVPEDKAGRIYDALFGLKLEIIEIK